MAVHAKDGTCLGITTAMALPFLREAERRLPRTGPGQKPTIPDWLLAALIMIAILKKKKTKNAQYRYLTEHRRGCRRGRSPVAATITTVTVARTACGNEDLCRPFRAFLS